MRHTGPVFVLGPQRSGANLLAWSLGQHPALTTCLSTRWLGTFLADLDRAFEEATVDDRSQMVASGIGRQEFHRAFGDVALRLLAGSTGEQTTRLVDPTPEHAFHVFALRWLFPDARFIHLVRDASSVVRLLVDKEVSKLFRTYHREHKAYEHWLSTVRACLRAERVLGSDAVLRVVYRDLVADPEATLRRCLAFVGEDWDAACLRPLDGITPDVEPLAEPEQETTTVPFRDEAVALSDALMAAPAPCYAPDPALIEELERAALQARPHNGTPSGTLALVARVRETVEAVVPAESHALVVSRGDDRLLELRGRTAGHFPQGDDGRYLGYHPADSAEAVARLEALRAGGARFLVIPSTSFWWLDHYRDFRRHLDERYAVVAHQQDVCVIYSLDPDARLGLELGAPAPDHAAPPGSAEALALRVQELEAELAYLRAEVGGPAAVPLTTGGSAP